MAAFSQSIDAVVEVCGAKSSIPQAISCLKPGGAYILVGLIHPDSHLNLTAETVMRKCLTIRGMTSWQYFYCECNVISGIDIQLISAQSQS